MISPTVGRITSPYGFRNHPIENRMDFHHGIDYSNVNGHDDILSVAKGKVKYIGSDIDGYGKYLVIEHDGFCSLYAHLHDILVLDKQSVIEGEKIALKGTTGSSTGIHLHFEIRKGSYNTFWYKYSNNEWKHSVDADLFLQANQSVQVDDNVSDYAREDFKWATEQGLLDGTRPKDPLLRQDLAVVLRRLRLGGNNE